MVVPPIQGAGLDLDFGLGARASLVAHGQWWRTRRCRRTGPLQELPDFFRPCGPEGTSIGAGLRVGFPRESGGRTFVEAVGGVHWFPEEHVEPYVGGRLGFAWNVGQRTSVEAAMRAQWIDGHRRIVSFLNGTGTAIQSFDGRLAAGVSLMLGYRLK